MPSMFNISPKKSAETISNLFLKYSVQDVATSLFVSNVWLPNIASPIKHLFLTAIFASLKPRKFSKSNLIASYEDFKSFVDELFALSPSFPELEDYVPEPDWGHVRFYHEGQNYKIFYGGELENIYDYLSLFQIFYGPFEKEYQERAGRSPTEELRYCLQLQDRIISGISHQATIDKMPELAPGHLEIPPSPFWENVISFYTKYTPPQNVSKPFLKQFSMKLGDLQNDFLKRKNFESMFFSGELLPVFFLSNGDRYFPILPRRYSTILLDDWVKVFQSCYEKMAYNGILYSMRIGTELHRYIKKRIRTNNLFPFVSAVSKEGLPHEILFSSAFISKNKLILIYIPAPSNLAQKKQYELAKIAPKLEEALRLISGPPVTLALHLDRQNIEFQSGPNGETLKPELFVATPQVSTQIISVSIPDALLCRITSLHHLLGILDDLEDVELLASFIEYLDKYAGGFSPMSNLLDRFASFKDSYGVLIGGASEPHLIFLDPHWGSNMRYESLAKFWKIYPEVNFFDHPRSWRVTQETSTRMRLEARGYFGLAIYFRLGQTHIFATAPFQEMSFEQGQITDLLMQCLEDSMSRRKAVLINHRFFDVHHRLQINFFPQSLVIDNEKFRHLLHLKPNGQKWRSDHGFVEKGVPAIRVVFNDKTLGQAFMDAKDASLEVDLLLEVLARVDEAVPDSNIDSMRNTLSNSRNAKPRFKMFWKQKAASFPEFIPSYEPTLGHFKRAKKRIAELSKELNISPGSYKAADAKVQLNALRDLVVEEIDSEVVKYAFEKTIPYLIIQIDALTHKHWRSQAVVEHALEHDVDYDTSQVFSKEQSKYSQMHRNYRYLIEKFVQLQPKGQRGLRKDEFQYLIALIDWLHVIYQASDSIHYGILPVRIAISDDYLVDVEYEADLALKQEVYAKEKAQLDLGIAGNPTDRVDSPRPVEDFLDELDRAFKQDLGFGLRSMVNVLQILSHWAEYGRVKENAYYSAGIEEIRKVCLNNIMGIDQIEIDPILKFLTLTGYDVIRILDQDTPCKDLPVWEHRKRYARYTLKPLILVGKEYHWGPYSTMKTGVIWSGSASSGMFPVDLQSPNVERVIESEKRLIEDALVARTLEIVERYTPHVRRNVDLQKIDRAHPYDLGDYDVLAYCPDANVVLNIECKDILPVYCLKDAKRLREKIFGRPRKDKGFFEKINRRQSYLSSHLTQIASDLRWPIDVKNLPKITTIFLSRTTYWWTKFPPARIRAVFLRVDQLSSFVEKLAIG